MTKKSDYEVGYCKPPKEHRFPKGKSGNPGGRPSKKVRALMPLQLRRDIIDVCERETRIRTTDGDIAVSIIEAVNLRIAQKALAGHLPLRKV
ncbi:DUF5681 domain-containing protein [Sphingomicrobium clamense]|uniref:DUF5681 domain-containing protein n=1 Tax=Sphingomicrobium clamense TaxID=2851013 RepID=A0ABS6V8G5_9SPHN|nr:DUF5681 domain-containing protein [Sphingomicrobium sp. B8]MBW0145781.1 hypothetical protein [Sphingomicrobium sp. B8]